MPPPGQNGSRLVDDPARHGSDPYGRTCLEDHFPVPIEQETKQGPAEAEPQEHDGGPHRLREERPALTAYAVSASAFLSAHQTRSGVSGSSRMRTPVAWATALQTAGATGMMPPSPIPLAP